jgi:hypothetical protein
VRDIGAIVWVLVVVVGVISSIVSNARKQMAASKGAPRPPARGVPSPAGQRTAAPVSVVPAAAAPAAVRQPSPSRAAPARRQPAPAPVPAPADLLFAHERPQPPARRLASMFGDRRSLVRAVIAAEVLGKPLALRDEIARR